MRCLFFCLISLFVSVAPAQQLEFDFGDTESLLKGAHYSDENLRESYDIPEGITKMWDERDFAFEIADGYYGYGPSIQYEILDKSGHVIGYMLVQTLIYSEDPEYHIAYTVCDVQGRTIIELEYDKVPQDKASDLLPPGLIPKELDN